MVPFFFNKGGWSLIWYIYLLKLPLVWKALPITYWRWLHVPLERGDFYRDMVCNVVVVLYMQVWFSIYLVLHWKETHIYLINYEVFHDNLLINVCLMTRPYVGRVFVVVVVVPVSRPYAMSELWGGGVPTSNSGQFSALDSGCPARIL